MPDKELSYFSLVRWLLSDYELPPEIPRQPGGDKVKAVIFLLLFFRNTTTGLAWPHQATIADLLGLSVPTVRRAMKHAAAERLIAVERTGEGNHYTFPRIEAAVAEAAKAERAAIEANLPRNCGTPWSVRMAKWALATCKIRPSLTTVTDTIESALVAGIPGGRIVQLIRDHPGQLIYAPAVLGDAIKNYGIHRVSDEQRAAAAARCRPAPGDPEGNPDA